MKRGDLALLPDGEDRGGLDAMGKDAVQRAQVAQLLLSTTQRGDLRLQRGNLFCWLALGPASCRKPSNPPDSETGMRSRDNAELYREIYREAEPIAELIPYMLESFLAADRGFAKARREHPHHRADSVNGRR